MMSIGNLKVKTKILMGTAFILMMMVALGFVASSSIASLLHSNRWVDHTHNVIRKAMSIEAAAVDMETGMRGFLLSGKEVFQEPLHSGDERFGKLINNLKKTVSDNPPQVELLGEIEGIIGEWKSKIVEPMIAFRKEVGISNTMDDVAELVGEAKGKTYFDEFRRKIALFKQREVDLMEIRQNKAKSDASEAKTVIVGGISVAVVISLIGSFVLATLITRPLENAVEVAQNVALGDLNTNIKIDQKDELGILAEALRQMMAELNKKVSLAGKISDGDLSSEVVLSSEKDNLGIALKTMTANLNGIVSNIMQGARTLTSSAEELASVATQISKATTEIQAQSNTVANASNEMTANIGNMASISEETSATIDSISATSNQLSQNVLEITNSLTGLSDTISNVSTKSRKASDITIQAKKMSQEATVAMNELSESANEINAVTGIIKAVADQTNLLALNANIEAASAGEAGKGFAVVANEIKELAQQSSNSAEAIASKVSEIQKSSEKSVVSMSDISEIILMINTSSNDITELVSGGAETINDLARNMQESNTGTAEIAKMIDEISRTAKDSAKSSAELSMGSSEITQNMVHLDKSVVDTADGISQISKQADGMNTLAVDLQTVVNRFKLMKS